MAPNTQRIKRAAIKPRYPLRQGVAQPSHENSTVRRGGKRGEMNVLDCHTLHETELSHLPTWAEIEYQGWVTFATSKFRVHEPLVHWFNKHVQFRYINNSDGSEDDAEMYVMCGSRKLKFNLEDFETHFDLAHEGFSDFYMQYEFPEDIPVGNLTELNLLLNRNRTAPRPSRRPDVAWQGYFTGDERFSLSLICKIFLHTSNSQTELTALESVVLYKMIHRQKINLPTLIINQIQNALTANNIDNYPHGQIVTFIVLHWKIHTFPTPIDDVGVKVIRDATLRRMGFVQENGSLVWRSKEQRAALKCPRTASGATGSGDSDESDGEDGDGADGPRRSTHAQLTSLQDGQARLQNEVKELRDTVHRNQREQQSWFSGITKFLHCWGKQQGASDEALAHLPQPPSSSSPP